MKTSTAGRQAIARHEGNKLKAYPDPATGGEPFTIGVGHTSSAGPPKVTKGMTITAAESDAILTRDLATFERAVEKAVKVPVTQAQFDAMVSLAFNIGGSAFAKSTLVKKLNAGDVTGAANAFLSWNKAAGKVMKGLTTRREAERKLFLAKSPQTPQPAAPKPVETAPIRTDSEQAVEPSITDKITVKVVQKRLLDLGYNVGDADGKIGKLTREGILSFRLDNFLPLVPYIDGKMLSSLDYAKPRELPRNDTSAETVREKVPEVRANWVAKMWGKVLALFGFGTSAAVGALDFVAPARGYIDQVRDLAADVPTWVWFAGIGAIAFALWRVAKKGEDQGVAAFRGGLGGREPAPSLMVLDQANVRRGYRELGGNGPHGHAAMQAPYFIDVTLCQFRSGVLLSTIARPVSDAVIAIFRRRLPRKMPFCDTSQMSLAAGMRGLVNRCRRQTMHMFTNQAVDVGILPMFWDDSIARTRSVRPSQALVRLVD